MIRKAIIVVLILAALPCGIVGVLSGLGCPASGEKVWTSGEAFTVGFQVTKVSWRTGLVTVTHMETVDASVAPGVQSWDGTWGRYFKIVGGVWETGQYMCSRILQAHFAIALALATLLAIYPTIAFIRGPARRWRRRRKGWCIHCGYDLTGNVTGVCSECGVKV